MKSNVKLPDAIDLSDPVGRLPLMVRLALGQAFGRIPGVHLTEARLAGTDMSDVVIEFSGWSPSLHRLDHRLTVHPAADVEEADYAGSVIDAATGILQRQTMRHRAGMEFGLSYPLPANSDFKDPPETRHLTVDSALPLFSPAGDADLVEELQEAIGLMHQRVCEEDGDALFASNAYALHCGLGHLVGANVEREATGCRMVYNGMSLDIYGPSVPETAITQLAGRPLGDLMLIHPAIDGRIVRTAESGDAGQSPRLKVTLVPDAVPFTSIADLQASYGMT